MAGLTAPAPRGACPGLLSPMASGDGLLLRVKPPVGGLTAARLAAVARGARAHGNGIVEITGRGNLQLRGFTAATATAFADAMLMLGLAEPEPAAESIRNILLAPLAGDDPSAERDAASIARAIEAGLRERPALWSLPPKFGFAVDAGGRMPLGDVSADIRLVPTDDGWRVGGTGLSRSVQVEASDAAATALRLAEAYARFVSARPDDWRRLRQLPRDEEAVIWRAAGQGATSPDVGTGRASACRFGIESYGNGRGTVAAAAPFGATDAATLESLAALMDSLGASSLTIGPWRSLHLRGVPETSLSTAAAAAMSLGLIVNPADPCLRVAACIGAPGCLSASVAARRDAHRVAAALPPGTGQVHIAGCAKGCASPAPAAVTLVGDGGRYALVRQGRAGDEPMAMNLDLDAAIRQATLLLEARA